MRPNTGKVLCFHTTWKCPAQGYSPLKAEGCDGENKSGDHTCAAGVGTETQWPQAPGRLWDKSGGD